MRGIRNWLLQAIGSDTVHLLVQGVGTVKNQKNVRDIFYS